MIAELPTRLEINKTVYEIRSDYRAILDICIALNDIELNGEEKALVALKIFYPELNTMPLEDYEEALKKCFWFIDWGEDYGNKPATKLVDWEQDFKYIVAPINRIIGKEVRSVDYMHWWTFLSAYMEIGDSTFQQIVAIRDKNSRHKPLEKHEREWYKRNKHLVDFKVRYTDEETELLNAWGV